MARFKQEVLEIMKTDHDLFAAISKALDVLPASLPVIIHRNGRTLNQYHIVTLVAAHLGKKPEDICEEESEVKEAVK